MGGQNKVTRFQLGFAAAFCLFLAGLLIHPQQPAGTLRMVADGAASASFSRIFCGNTTA